MDLSLQLYNYSFIKENNKIKVKARRLYDPNIFSKGHITQSS